MSISRTFSTNRSVLRAAVAPLLAWLCACGAPSSSNAMPAWLYLQNIGALDRPADASALTTHPSALGDPRSRASRIDSLRDTRWTFTAHCPTGGGASLDQQIDIAQHSAPHAPFSATVRASGAFDLQTCHNQGTHATGQLTRALVAPMGQPAHATFDDRLTGTLQMQIGEGAARTCDVDLTGRQSAPGGGIFYSGTLCGEAVERWQAHTAGDMPRL